MKVGISQLYPARIKGRITMEQAAILTLIFVGIYTNQYIQYCKWHVTNTTLELEEKDPTISQAKWKKQMVAGLPKLLHTFFSTQLEIGDRSKAFANALGNDNCTAAGMDPFAHLEMYKVWHENWCSEIDIVAAMDAVLMMELMCCLSRFCGESIPFYNDGIDIWEFAATHKDIFVSKGNSKTWEWGVEALSGFLDMLISDQMLLKIIVLGDSGYIFYWDLVEIIIKQYNLLAFCVHGSLMKITNREPKFMGHFWRTLWKKMGTQMCFSTSYHPETDGQTEVVNRSLRNLLRCLAGDKPKQWDLVIPFAEFAYNNSRNRTTQRTPFEVVYGLSPNSITDLAPIPNLKNTSVEAFEGLFSGQVFCMGVLTQGRYPRRSYYKSSNITQMYSMSSISSRLRAIFIAFTTRGRVFFQSGATDAANKEASRNNLNK
ncbi:putative CCCH-type zinc finger family protein [Tanacetum coccineum]